MPRIYVIDGPIGAGKSTLLNLLEKKFKCFEEPIKDWGELLGDFYKDMSKFAYPFQFQVLLSQKKQYDKIKKINAQKVFVERSPYNSKFIFFNMLKDEKLITSEEEQVYNKHFDNISYEPEHYFILKLPVELAYKRIKTRDRVEERNIDIKYLTSLHKKYDDMYNDKKNVSIIDATKNPYEIFWEIEKELSLIN